MVQTFVRLSCILKLSIKFVIPQELKPSFILCRRDSSRMTNFVFNYTQYYAQSIFIEDKNPCALQQYF